MVGISTCRNWVLGGNVTFIRLDTVGQVYASTFFEN